MGAGSFPSSGFLREDAQNTQLPPCGNFEIGEPGFGKPLASLEAFQDPSRGVSQWIGYSPNRHSIHDTKPYMVTSGCNLAPK